MLKPNEAMFEEALRLGSRIAMLVTFPTAADSMRPEFEALARARSVKASFDTIHVAHAAAALKSGDAQEHNRLIAQAACQLVDAVDVVLLGQFSMAPAADEVAQVIRQPVLTAPSSAVRKLRALLEP